jgi:hypothetical protein
MGEVFENHKSDKGVIEHKELKQFKQKSWKYNVL